jgi:hypothetical protein
MAYSAATGTKVEGNKDAAKDLFNGIPSVFPMVENAVKSSQKYGTFSKAFAIDTVTPGAIKDVMLERGGSQKKKWGSNEEARLRHLTGLFKEEEAVKMKDKLDQNAGKKQDSNAKKFMKSIKPGPRFTWKEDKPENSADPFAEVVNQ